MDTTPFQLNVSQLTLDDLQDRLLRTRWPEEPEGAGWTMGADSGFMRRLVDRWLHRYDWRAAEADINRHPGFTADVSGTKLHFVHVKGKGPNPTPLLLVHSFPDSFYRFHHVIDRLTDPAAFGGDPADSFDVVVPSLPGWAFSTHTPVPVHEGADLLAQLMGGLGYSRFLAGGGDGPIPIALSQRHPGHVAGIYVVDVGYPDASTDFATLRPSEVEFAQWIQGWWMREGAFNMIQSTKPQSLAFAMNDSPAGLAAWLMILISSGGQVDERFDLDTLITNAMIYWVSGSIGPAMRNYLVHAMATYGPNPPAKAARSDVPAAFARLPLDAPVPDEWIQRNVNAIQITDFPRGGHFSSWEVPELFVDDVRAFARKVR